MKQHKLPRKIEAEAFQSKLLSWYHKNKRYMPWREDPTPYHVWISEIMLQQTRVEAVHGYYLRFLERLPDIKSLAQVDDDELHKLWEGLGYYNRAKNLKKAAELLVEQYEGKLPSTYEQLLKLPGIGPYTAGAIASIAFHQAVPAVDGNVMRVISRISGDDRDIMEQSTRKAMEVIVQELILPEEVHHFNQALMELGALICIPNGAPKCEICPMASLCYAYETASQSVLPVKKPKKQRKIEERTVLVFVNEKGEFLIQKRDKKGLLSGLWEFSQIEAKLSQSELKELLETHGIYAKQIAQIESSKHIFTHIEWLMQGYLIEVSNASEIEDKLYVSGEELSEKHKISGDRRTSEDCKTITFQSERIWCDFETLKSKYSIPAAFKTYVESIEKGMIHFALGL